MFRRERFWNTGGRGAPCSAARVLHMPVFQDHRKLQNAACHPTWLSFRNNSFLALQVVRMCLEVCEKHNGKSQKPKLLNNISFGQRVELQHTRLLPVIYQLSKNSRMKYVKTKETMNLCPICVTWTVFLKKKYGTHKDCL